jgi:hypothetical protein
MVLAAFAASAPTMGELQTAAIEAVEKRLAKTATIRVRGFYGMTHHKVSAVIHHKVSAEYWTCGTVGVESKGLSERIPFIVRHHGPDPTVFFNKDTTPWRT